jgi:hypothetical protein
MSTIINLYGGPGTGKSTSAALLFYLLKNQKADVELVREYVKDWAWEGRKISTYDQLYFLGKQVRKESMLYGKVDWIVTDAPIMLSIYYAMEYCPVGVSEAVRAATLAYYRQAAEDGHKHVHVFLKRTKPYNPKGRFQNEAQAKDIDVHLRRMLDQLKFPYKECETDEASLRTLLGELGT